MLGASVANRLKALDVYKKMPRELTEATVSGAMGNSFSFSIFWLFLLNLVPFSNLILLLK